jgi:hypothetical protein
MYAVKYVEPVNAVQVDGDGGDHVLAMVNPAGLGGRTGGVRAVLTGRLHMLREALNTTIRGAG